ncbi:DUF493 domain-containing protein [Sulfurimonas sp. MAG313]|nr:DUF493 domain-containing protein [Sulfurimonas sp. MAG313]MDF1880795.1 DUF493 domain-containing protein [Sulfurimonas sp. MAG313]
MENISDIEQKVLIEYPCSWQYKIITMHEDHTKEAVLDVINERLHTLTHSHNSKGGKYISMNLDVLVHNEDDRNFIYEALKAHHKTKMIL